MQLSLNHKFDEPKFTKQWYKYPDIQSLKVNKSGFWIIAQLFFFEFFGSSAIANCWPCSPQTGLHRAQQGWTGIGRHRAHVRNRGKSHSDWRRATCAGPQRETPTLLTLSTCWHIHTQTFVLRYRHTPMHIHTAGPSQLTPCHSTDHIQSSRGTGGHMWIIIHAN